MLELESVGLQIQAAGKDVKTIETDDLQKHHTDRDDMKQRATVHLISVRRRRFPEAVPNTISVP